MSFSVTSRLSDSPFVETVIHGGTVGSGSTMRPAENHWHLVVVKRAVAPELRVVGPWSAAGALHYLDGTELLWIKLKLGAYMPHLPTRELLNRETLLPPAGGKSFWLKGASWGFPSYENADTFVCRLMREGVLSYDPLVSAALQDKRLDTPARTMRHRFLHSTGLTQTHIRQLARAQQATALLQQGSSILDTAYQLGYYDQPHMTRSLKQFIGYTPAQLLLPKTSE